MLEVTMELMRHNDIRLTMTDYNGSNLLPLARELDKVPSLKSSLKAGKSALIENTVESPENQEFRIELASSVQACPNGKTAKRQNGKTAKRQNGKMADWEDYLRSARGVRSANLLLRRFGPFDSFLTKRQHSNPAALRLPEFLALLKPPDRNSAS